MLDFEYREAGLYQTYFYRNGYKYKIEKDDYARTPSWTAYYQWHKWTDKKRWKKVPGYDDFRTKKEAVAACESHNKNPKPRYKRFDTVSLDTMDRYKMRVYGFYIYKEVDANGEPINYGHNKNVNPKDVGGKDLLSRNIEWIKQAKQNIKERDPNAWVTDYSSEVLNEFKRIAQAYEDKLQLDAISKQWEQEAVDG